MVFHQHIFVFIVVYVKNTNKKLLLLFLSVIRPQDVSPTTPSPEKQPTIMYIEGSPISIHDYMSIYWLYVYSCVYQLDTALLLLGPAVQAIYQIICPWGRVALILCWAKLMATATVNEEQWIFYLQTLTSKSLSQKPLNYIYKKWGLACLFNW